MKHTIVLTILVLLAACGGGQPKTVEKSDTEESSATPFANLTPDAMTATYQSVLSRTPTPEELEEPTDLDTLADSLRATPEYTRQGGASGEAFGNLFGAQFGRAPTGQERQWGLGQMGKGLKLLLIAKLLKGRGDGDGRFCNGTLGSQFFHSTGKQMSGGLLKMLCGRLGSGESKMSDLLGLARQHDGGFPGR